MTKPTAKTMLSPFDGRSWKAPGGRVVARVDGERYLMDAIPTTGAKSSYEVELIIAAGRQHLRARLRAGLLGL